MTEADKRSGVDGLWILLCWIFAADSARLESN